ncbi:hypothetical protein WJX81_001007 [Elliptochloris bilobata]|uniref:Uncharacterized protein n=1 Tax=Elliptochloris bilobata TaxID=381761 RepID=A0AAW1S6S3_9CHLO
MLSIDDLLRGNGKLPDNQLHGTQSQDWLDPRLADLSPSDLLFDVPEGSWGGDLCAPRGHPAKGWHVSAPGRVSAAALRAMMPPPPVQVAEELARRAGSTSTVSTCWAPAAAAGWLERQCASEGSVPKRELHHTRSGPAEPPQRTSPTSSDTRGSPGVPTLVTPPRRAWSADDHKAMHCAPRCGKRKCQPAEVDPDAERAYLMQQVADLQAEKLSIEGHVSVLEQALVEAVHMQARPTPALAARGQLARPQSSPAAQRQRESAVPLMFDAMQPFDGQARIVVAACDNLVTTAAEVSELPWSKFVMLMKECVYGVAGALAEAAKAGPGACAAAQRASDIGRSTALLVAAVAGGNPKHARTAFSLRLDRSQPCDAAPSPQAAWARVAQILHLSPVQCRELVRLRVELLGRLQPLLQERAALAAGLGSGPPAPGGGGDTVAALSMDYLRWAHQAERMGANLDADHRLMREFCARVTCRVLTPRQYAQALVASYPYLPDALALAGCVATAEAPPGASARDESGASPDPKPAVAARTLRPAAPSGEFAAVSGCSMTSAFPKKAKAPARSP